MGMWSVGPQRKRYGPLVAMAMAPRGAVMRMDSTATVKSYRENGISGVISRKFLSSMFRRFHKGSQVKGNMTHLGNST